MEIGDARFVRLSDNSREKRPIYTLIDAEDFERVTRTVWHYKGGYAHAGSSKYLASHHKRLHAYILRSQPGELIDHINGDRLDNRKQNLRIVTQAQNNKNAKRPTFPGKTSRFKGVCWDRYNARWIAGVTSDGVHHHLGFYDDEVQAARVYDEAALLHHGEYARTNAMMKLYEMEDPFVQDCSDGPVFLGRKIGRRYHRSVCDFDLATQNRFCQKRKPKQSRDLEFMNRVRAQYERRGFEV